MIQRTGRAAKLLFPVHPHMLRHSTGYKLANQGEDTRSLAHYLEHVPAQLNQGDSHGAKDGRVYRH
jgi:site-specific recombinase XerD